jgi:hypothetical protein
MRIVTLLFVLLISGCQINPVTGDNNVKIISNDKAIEQAKVAYVSILRSSQNHLDQDPAQYQRIQKIFNTLLPYAKKVSTEASRWDWEFHVIKSSEINAGCMAGGKIIVWSGLIDKLNPSDDGIAFIMAHEIGHALAGHTSAKQSLQILTNIGLLAVNSKYNNDAQTQDKLRTLSDLLISLPYSRLEEDQADKIGLDLMTRAGYRPEKSLEFFQKMIAMNGSNPIDFFNSHPSDSARISNLTKLIPEIKNIDPNQPTLSLLDDDFKKFSNGLIELDCDLGCSWGDGANRKQVIDLYDKRMWKELAVVIVKIKRIRDLNYFYLGRSAEELGYKEAAKVYYKKAIELSSSSTRCDRTFKYQCNGISVAKESEDGLNRLW